MPIKKHTFEEANRKTFDEIWVVFDKDDEGNNPTTLNSFEQAVQLAKANKIHLAFSNEVFELWLLLHFCEVDAKVPLPRAEVYRQLEAAVKRIPEQGEFVYRHGKTDLVDVVFAHGAEANATKRAEDLLAYH